MSGRLSICCTRSGVLALLLCLSACARPQPQAGRDVVSLAPAATRALVDLGLQDRLAAVTQFDPVCPPGCLRLGPAGAVDTETVLALRPKAVLAQESAGLPGDLGLRQAAARGHFAWHAWPAPQTVAEALSMPERVGAALGVPAEPLAQRARARWQALAAGARPPKRVLLLTGMAPEVGALGPGFVHDEILRSLGGVNALPGGSPGWVPLDGEAVAGCGAEVILWLRPEADPDHASAEPPPGWRSGGARVEVLADPWVLVPSSNVPELAEAMRARIWPAEGGGR